MRALKVCLWVLGLLCLSGLLGLLLPISTMQALAETFGEQPFPDSPLFNYTVRAMSATYVLVGIFFIILARDPLRYGPLVPFSGAAGIILGIVCAVTGALLGMPIMWFAGDALFCIVFGAAILILWKRAASSAAEPGSSIGG